MKTRDIIELVGIIVIIILVIALIVILAASGLELEYVRRRF